MKQKNTPSKPKGATHVRLITPEGRKAFEPIYNLDCLEGIPGELTWIKKTRTEEIELKKERIK